MPTSQSTTTEATTTTEAAPEFEALVADPNLTPEEQVEAAYLHSWDIYLDALRTGQTEYLELAYMDATLATRTDEVGQLADAGHVVTGGVDHNYEVTVLTETNAVVVDEYQNHLVLADGATLEPLEQDPDSLAVYKYDLILEDGSWRVAFSDKLS